MATKRTGLGRGIGALIPMSDETRSRPVDVFFPTSSGNADDGRTESARRRNAAAAHDDAHSTDDADSAETPPDQGLRSVPGARLANLDPNDIVPNAQQPRTDFRQEELDELMASIREIGVLQPIVVRPVDDAVDGARFELVMGERRLRATKALGLTSIPAVIKDTADDAMLRDALLENLHRSELNPLEEASAYQQLLSDFGITQERLAERIGRSRPQISNTLRLLRLPAIVQQRVAAGVLSAGHARAVLSVVDETEMIRLADKIVNEDLSVRAAEAAATARPRAMRPRPAPSSRQGALDEVAERLGDRFDTRVRVSSGGKKGSIIIEFATIADLNRITREMGVEGFGS
ncbi:ParB/RepB/Spo0J family partition protein [Planctomonas psychrotolerans]|uniref:ParB/RepB/Spo0J family partition protein n=1 Tax=Planctomonas psychrotolerans TaxID=2528712 RepID=UPI00123BA76E|nr:ParB/RepB/Spo0J family partition protein [Planctomonas psychrotolerans]